MSISSIKTLSQVLIFISVKRLHGIAPGGSCFPKDVQALISLGEGKGTRMQLAVVTEWKKFRNRNFNKIKEFMNHPTIFDGRNIYDPEKLSALGF